MGIRFYKPVTPGRRGASVSDFAEITDKKKRPEKELTSRQNIARHALWLTNLVQVAGSGMRPGDDGAL